MSRKGLARMIRSVAFADQETKKYQVMHNVYTNALPTSGQFGQVINIVGGLPDYRNSGVDPAASFVGDKIYVKGLKIRVQTRNYETLLEDVHPIRYRISLISTTNFDELANPITNSPIPVVWYEPTTTIMQLTSIRFDPNKIQILKSYQWTLDPRDTAAQVKQREFYYKFNRWFTTENESNSVPRFFGLRGNGKQYYIMLEAWDVTGITIATSKNSCLIDEVLYFKDS